MFEIRNISKSFATSEGLFFALKDVSFSLPSKGIFAIKGRSGSGKSTLLNMLSLTDGLSGGEIFFKGRSLSKLNDRQREDYRNLSFSFIYQHFNLIEDDSAFDNAAWPLRIRGMEEKSIKAMLEGLFEKYGLSYLKDKKTYLLSGGEKQRVAIIRSISTNPEVIFADEPTGALDHVSERIVMEDLLKISKDSLVVFVSHNEKLIEEYAEGVLTLEDGRLISDSVGKKLDEDIKEKEAKRGRSRLWIGRQIRKNYRRNLFKNVLSLLSGTISYLSLLISLGFCAGSQKTLEKEKYHSLRYLTASVSKQERHQIEGSPLELVKNVRPFKEEIPSFPGIRVHNDYSFFFPSHNTFSINGYPFEPASFVPIYSFASFPKGKDFIIEGEFPKGDSLGYCLVNEAFASFFPKAKVGETIKVPLANEVRKKEAKDDFSMELNLQIFGIVSEFSFLSSPTVYYSYGALEARLHKAKLENISLAEGKEESVYSLVSDSKGDSPYASYSYLLFGEDNHAMKRLEEASKEEGELVISSSSFTINSSFESLAKAFSLSLVPFLIISLISVSFILGSLAYSLFLERKKEAAIIYAMGARRKHLGQVYEAEPLISSLLSVVTAFLLSFPFSKFFSFLLEKEIGLPNLIEVPYLKFMGIYLFPFLALLALSLFIAFVGSVLPLESALRKPLLSELKDE